MKKISTYATTILLATFLISSPGCSKKNEKTEEGDCKTCKAYKTATRPEVSQQVCSDQSEQTFRTQHSGQEITCQ